MLTVEYTPSNRKACVLGRQLENDARQIIFDLSDYIETYGEGTATLINLRCTDTIPYIVPAVQDGTTLTWTVSNVDTAFKGTGEAELRWYVGETLAKSTVFPTTVKRSITTDTEMPEDIETWYDAMIEYLDTKFEQLQAELAKTLVIEEGE